jgi:Rps23 Pro-64 3,4-dihydroxylase Tpa1-like proline 4-hydroxylase
MKTIEHAVGIYEIENFLTEDEINGLLLSADPNGFIESHPGNIVQDLNPQSLEYISEISEKVLSCFDNADSHTQITKIRRLRDGEFMHPHKDGGYPDSKKTIVFGIAIYLNEDFQGGELNYPDLNISIKPKRSSMLIHDAKLLHQVLPVQSGSRYSITTFVFGTESTKFKQSNFRKYN